MPKPSWGADFAYGESGVGPIPANADLVFEADRPRCGASGRQVELVSINGKKRVRPAGGPLTGAGR